MKDNSIDLSISTVIYKNRREGLIKLFDSLSNTNLKTRVFIIDNYPAGTLDEICTKYAFVYIPNYHNIGFGAGHNLVIRKILEISRYHLIINPDIYFERGNLEKIYNFMENNLEVGMAMPKVLYPDGSIQYLSRLLPNPLSLMLRKIKIPFLSKRSNDIYELVSSDHNSIIEAPYLSGCFMFIRTEVFKKVGLFDERFFMYFEDVDLSRRIHQYYRTLYYPESVIYHDYKGSDEDFKLIKFIFSSGIKYFNKWGWFFDRERTNINEAILKNL